MKIATYSTPTLQQEAQRAAQLLHTLPKPASKLEEWKHTPLWKYISQPFCPFRPELVTLPAHPTTATICLSEQIKIQPSQTIEIHTAGLQDPLPPQAGRLAGDNHWTEALNRAHLSDLIIVSVKAGSNAILHIKSEYPSRAVREEALLVPVRLLITVGENAIITVQEQVEAHKKEEHPIWWNQVVEMWTEKGARVRWLKLQKGYTVGTLLTDHTFIRMREGSSLQMLTWTEGFEICRNMPHIQLAEPLSSAFLWGLSISTPHSLVDNHTFVEHIAPQTHSNEHYRGVVAPQATAVFHGRIYVHQDAQQTNAYQQDRYILLDESSRVYSEPQLEIFADDVRCTHGAAVGFTDNLALFYSRTRGIPEVQARMLLLGGFLSAVLSEFCGKNLREEMGFLWERLNSSLQCLFHNNR